MTTRTAERPGVTRLRPLAVAGGLATLLLCAAGAVLLGAVDLGWQRVLGEVLAQLTGSTSPLNEREAAIVWQLRAPRVALAAVVGAALAGAGAAFQGVFRNPLADPYLLGAASGAGLAATLVMVLAPAGPGWVLGTVQLAAFAGALGGVGLSWLLSRSVGGAGTATLLLAGIAVAAFLSAVQAFVQQLDTDSLQQVYTWMLGGLATGGWRELSAALPSVIAAAGVLLACARLLDVLALGDTEARALGIRPGVLRLALLGAASLATAAAVSVSGLVGFVGIVVPHIVRLLFGWSYRVVVPMSLITGAVFVILADQIARSALPGELPLGVVTAFAGAPFFALVLYRNREAAT
ncbi:iron ABC transporter permease [Haloechinothrix sp. LS1_15]|uniref:FecCD family ABC transporter permease n=1 Tax=Haloechinothrix sp. LS1_15 TaxID=2652248 RepID=UPI002946F712|nr:iron ABC transporter permease [Haloechinothrix sp. LS1_15]MDV6012672.1 iron ABC transporter permease [Haloechinothrix sp. LS1_15]